MFREDRELLAELKRVCTDATDFVLEYIAGELPIKAEEAYAYRLIDLGERLLDHVKTRRGIVLDGEPTPLVIDAGFVRIEDAPPELPPGDSPDPDEG